MSYIQDFLAILGQPDHEGTIPFLYKDSTGNLTVGKGSMLPTLDASQALQWYAHDDIPATPDAIKDDWIRVFRIPKGLVAARYESPTGLYLMPEEIDMQAEAAVRKVDNALTGRLSYYDALPDPVKLALLDLGYNLGIAGLLDKFPKLMEAVKNHDWPTAIEECGRPQLSNTRNAWTRAQFTKAI